MVNSLARVLSLLLILLLLLPLSIATSSSWVLIGVDGKDLSEDSFLDLRRVYTKIENGLHLKLEFWNDIPKNGTVIAEILLDSDMNPYTGAEHGSGFGIDYSLTLEVSENTSNLRVVPWNDTLKYWDAARIRDVKVETVISGSTVAFALPRDVYNVSSRAVMILKTLNSFLEGVNNPIIYNYTGMGDITVDGSPDDWVEPPLISLQENGSVECLDCLKSIYFSDDGHFLYVRVDTSRKPLNRTLDGTLFRRFQFYVDKDLNKSTGEPTNGYDYYVILSFAANKTGKSCLTAVLRWDRYAGWHYHYSSQHLISYNEVMEAGIGFGILEAEPGGQQGIYLVGLVTMLHDYFKGGKPIVIPRAIPPLSTFSLEAKSDIDYELCSNYSDMFKQFSRGNVEKPAIKLGGPLIYPDEWSGHDANFTVENGVYVGVTYFGDVLRSEFGVLDYCVISVVECGEHAKILVGGVTRYGTLAGLVWLINNIDIVMCMDYMVEWRDINGDGMVTIDEVNLIWYNG